MITITYEPCELFEADGEAPVCLACGWLDDEHSAGEYQALTDAAPTSSR